MISIYTYCYTLDAIDIAEGLKKLYDLLVTGNSTLSVYQFALDMEKQLGLKQAQIRNYLSLVNLTPELKELVTRM